MNEELRGEDWGCGVSNGTLEGGVLELARTGDSFGFERIVREYQSMVFSLAYYFLHDAGRAEEIAQETFLRLYQNLDRIESPAHLVQWLRKVTWRCAIDDSRKNSHQHSVSFDEAPEPAVEPKGGDLLAERSVRAMVASLPPRPRMMVILRYQEELELAEIAEVMGIPVNTVKSSLNRALGVLRSKLTRVLGDVTA